MGGSSPLRAFPLPEVGEGMHTVSISHIFVTVGTCGGTGNFIAVASRFPVSRKGLPEKALSSSGDELISLLFPALDFLAVTLGPLAIARPFSLPDSDASTEALTGPASFSPVSHEMLPEMPLLCS